MNKVISRAYVEEHYIPRRVVNEMIDLIEQDLDKCQYMYQKHITQKHLRIIRGKVRHYDKEIEDAKKKERYETIYKSKYLR